MINGVSSIGKVLTKQAESRTGATAKSLIEFLIERLGEIISKNNNPYNRNYRKTGGCIAFNGYYLQSIECDKMPGDIRLKAATGQITWPT